MSKPAKHLKKSKAQTFTWNVIAVASNDPQKRKNLKVSFIAILKPSFNYQVQMKWFFIAEFKRAAKSQEDRRLPCLNIFSSSRVTTV